MPKYVCFPSQQVDGSTNLQAARPNFDRVLAKITANDPSKRPKPRFSMNKHYAELATQIEGMDMFSKKNHTFDRLRLSKDRNDLEERVDEGAQRQGEATGYSGHDHALPTDARQGEERGTGDWQAETASRLGSKFRYDPDRPRHISQGLPYAGAGVETMRPNVSGEGGQGAGIGGQVLERLGREVGGGRKSVADMVQAASLPSRVCLFSRYRP